MHFFGAPSVTLSHQPLVQLVRSPILLNLLAFLVIHRTRPHARSIIAAIFWPEIPESRARQYLNIHLSRLRHVLKTISTTSYLLCDNQTIQFNSAAPFWLDVAEFEAVMSGLSQDALTRSVITAETLSRLENAIELYRADFLEGSFLDWCLRLREQLHDQFLIALETLTRAYQAAGQYEAALRAALRLVQTDPLREAAHFSIIQLCVQLGRVHEAHTHYQRYQAIWRSELNLDPSPRVQAFLNQLDTITLASINSPGNRSVDQDITLLNPLLVAFENSHPNTPEERVRHMHLCEQIAEYTERVGRTFKACYANTQAVHYLGLCVRALRNLPSSRERNEQELILRCELDELYDLCSDWERQADNLRRAHMLARKLADLPKQADVLARQAWQARGRGRYQRAIHLLQKMLVILQEDGEMYAKHLALANRLLGIVHNEVGNLLSAYQYQFQALSLDQRLNLSQSIYLDRVNLASVLRQLGRYGEALQHLTQAQDLVVFDTSMLARATLLGNLGILWLKLGQWSRANDDLRKAMALALQAGDRETECWLGGQLALLYQRQGESNRALNAAHYYYGLVSELKAPRRQMDLAELLADLYWENCDGKNALAWADCTATLARKHAVRRYQFRSRMRQSQAYLLLHEPGRAYENAQRAVHTFEAWNQPLEEMAELFWIVACCAQQAGDRVAAAAGIARARKALLALADSIPDSEHRKTFLKHHPAADSL
jgi:DNA-binding SARP family transcriptional activator